MVNYILLKGNYVAEPWFRPPKREDLVFFVIYETNLWVLTAWQMN